MRRSRQRCAVRSVAFVIGAAITAVVKSLVDNLIMPVVGLVLPGGDWQSAIITLKEATETAPATGLGIGNFISALINFIIIAFVVFMMAKIVLKEEKVTKK
ncbi:MAG: MscL family protein [Candidatus Micrarchaeota archaeon]